MHFIPKFQ